MTRTECWCKRKNIDPIPNCMMCRGKGYVDTPDTDPSACGICGMVPTRDDRGITVRHSPQCPKAATDVPTVSEPVPVEAPSEPLDFDTVAEAEAPFASGGAAVPPSTPEVAAVVGPAIEAAAEFEEALNGVNAVLSGPEPTQAAEERDEAPGSTPGSFAAGMDGSARSADRWSDEQKVAVRVAIRYAALMNAEFTTDEVWARLWSIDPDFPVTKGMAGILSSMCEDDGGTDPAALRGPGGGSGLTKAGKPATMRRTGRTRKPQREDVNHAQRLAIYESLVHDPSLCPQSLRGPIPAHIVGQSDRHRKPGDALLIRCSVCMALVDVVIYDRRPYLATHPAAVAAEAS